MKKRVLVLIISISMTEDSIKAVSIKVFTSATTSPSLKYILYIYHLVQFKKDQVKVQALWDFVNKVNIMILIYMASLSLTVWSTNVGAQKIDGFIFKMFKMVLASF